MSLLQTKFPTDTWVAATWDEFIEAIADPARAKAKGYYYNGQLRIEMASIGSDHSDDNGIIVVLVNLFGIAKGMGMRLRVNCSYRKTKVRECQPDASYYIGERVKLAPRGSSPVDLDSNQPPDLAIEIADSSLIDDLGPKRMLYEDMEIGEYWVVDGREARITAFQILANGGSQRIAESWVLPGLQIALLEEGLQRSRQADQDLRRDTLCRVRIAHQTLHIEFDPIVCVSPADNTEVGTWFLAKIQEA